MPFPSNTWKTHRNCVAIALVAVFAGLASLHADTLTFGDKRQVAGKITAIRHDQAVLATAQTIPLADLAAISFDQPAVVAYPSGLFLRNGTRLCGLMRTVVSNQLVFRSVTMGEATIPMSQVALLYFGERPPTSIHSPQPPATTCVNFSKGTTREGILFGLTMNNIVLRTDQGLERIAVSNITAIVQGPPSSLPAVILRNQDRLALPVTWAGTNFTATVGNTTVTLPLDSIRAIYLKAAAKK